MTIESVIREQRQVIERLWAENTGGSEMKGETRRRHERLFALGDTLMTGAAPSREWLERLAGESLLSGSAPAEVVWELALLERCVVQAWHLLTGQWPNQAELRPVRETVTTVISLLLERSNEERMRNEHFAERQAVDALEHAAQAALEDPANGAAPCLEAVRLGFGAGAAAALFVFDGAGTVHERTIAETGGTHIGAITDEVAWEVARKRELVELDDPLAIGRALPLAGERRGVLFVLLPSGQRPTGATGRMLETIADRLGPVLDQLQHEQQAFDELERLGEERALRERFVATPAHDLRGPLMAARISIECILGSLSRPDLVHCARRAVQSISRADGMMRDLLDASRVRAGQPLPLDLGACDLYDITREIVEDLTLQYGPRFVLRVEPGIRGVWCARELSRALWNLLMNALRHGQPARPIVVSAAAEANRVRITVENDGPAIAPEALERIFDPYERRSGDGWGLGLTLVRACAQAHGGDVTVSSGEGTPTVFTIRLPLDSRPYYAQLLEHADSRGPRAHVEH
jgi:signal transduction histidine kinase